MAVLVLWGGWHWKKRISAASSEAPVPISAQAPLFDPHDKPMTVVLKGIDVSSGKVVGYKTVIRESKTRYNQMKQVVLAYLGGPREGKIQVPVPSGMGLNQFYLTAEGSAVIDLSLNGVKPESFGFYEEVLFVRGMIEALTGNFFEVKQVKLLADGQDALVLGGHYALGTSEANRPPSLAVSKDVPPSTAP